MPAEASWSHRFVVASLRAGQPAEVRMRGWSMAPSLVDGDVLTVEPLVYIGRGPLVVGEVVLAERGDVLVAHRVIAVAADAVVTRGDALSVDDPRLPRSEILGRVVRHRRAPFGRLRPAWLRLLRALGFNALY